MDESETKADLMFAGRDFFHDGSLVWRFEQNGKPVFFKNVKGRPVLGTIYAVKSPAEGKFSLPRTAPEWGAARVGRADRQRIVELAAAEDIAKSEHGAYRSEAKFVEQCRNSALDELALARRRLKTAPKKRAFDLWLIDELVRRGAGR